MKRYSWACGAGDWFVICHHNHKELDRFPYGICCPINGASKWELIDILEAQDATN